jgi:hypothetical protein
LRIYRCPSDPTTSGDPFYGPCSYPTNNLLCATRVRIPESVPRGTAETILFAEKYGACSYWAMVWGREVPWYVADETFGFQVQPQSCDPKLPQTPHREGIQTGMLDGSVRMFARDTNPRIWFVANAPAHLQDTGGEP